MVEGARTSRTHPLEIGSLETPLRGRIGVTFAPGKHQLNAATGVWRRDLTTDLDVVAAWGAKAVVTLLESSELMELNIADLGQEVRRRQMEWLHLPIRDCHVPGPAFEDAWPAESRRLRELLSAGSNVLIHCKGGLGRAGMIAARLLVELGAEPAEAIESVRAVRPGAIETCEQERWVAKGARPFRA